MSDKIDWSQVPEWAQFVATNEDGGVWGYEFKPVPCSPRWVMPNSGRSILLSRCPHWRDTLVERPNPVKHERWSWMFPDGVLSNRTWESKGACVQTMMCSGHPVLISWEE